MMKNGEKYAVAVRRPDGEIEIKKDSYRGITTKCALFRVPFIRGIFSFIESLSLGMNILNYSASFYEEEEEKGAQISEEEAARQKKKEDLVMGVTMIFAVVLAVGIFMLLPTWIAGFFRRWISGYLGIAVLEGVIRIAIFIGYVAGISLMKDIRRVFMYHGAEHKCINCIEHGLPLTVENVRRSSKEHKRCGTSFLLFVIVISTVVVMFVRTDTVWLRMVSRILLLPVVTGISYEFLRLAGRSDSRLVNALSRPGLLLQGLTTREPDDDMIEVGIASVEAVFDWRAYLRENFPESSWSEEAASDRQETETASMTAAEAQEPVSGQTVENAASACVCGE